MAFRAVRLQKRGVGDGGTTVVVFEMASGPDHKAAGSETRTLHWPHIYFLLGWSDKELQHGVSLLTC